MGNSKARSDSIFETVCGGAGRVQLLKIGDMIDKRRQLASGIEASIADLKAVRLGSRLPKTEGVYWFMRFQIEVEKLTVDKEAFAAAVAAEGIPVTASYRQIPSHFKWFKERQVFPGSDYPWGLPAYKGDRDAQFPCPNAIAAVESHFIMFVHENWGPQEVDDVAAALGKVETAYLR